MTKKNGVGKLDFFIARGDSFDLDFANYHLDERFEQVRKLMAERRFTVGETSVAYRVINHWGQSDILPDGVKDGAGWRKFTLPEMAWLRVVNHLREFGLPLEKIAKVKKKAIEWNKRNGGYPYFEYYLAKALASKSEVFVCVLSDGQAEVATSQEVEASKLFLGNLDILLISLKSILEEMGLAVSTPETLFSLTEKERELLAALRMERSHEVRAKISSDGEISEIESTTTTTNPLSSQELKDTLSKNKMYGRVVTQYEDGKPKSVQVTKRKKF